MFVDVVNFGQVQKIRFVVVKFFWSYSNQFLVILIRSRELASNILQIFLIFPVSILKKIKDVKKFTCESKFYSFTVTQTKGELGFSDGSTPIPL